MNSLKAITTVNAVSMNSLLDRFIAYLDVSGSSVRTYTFGVRRFLQFLQDKGIKAPTRDNVIEYKKDLVEKHCKPATIALYLSAIRRFFSWLESEELYSNITAGVKSPKQDVGHKRDALSATQLKGCLQGISRDSLEGKRNYAIFSLIATTGLRTIEVVRANVEDIRYVQGVPVLYVQGKGRSSKSEFVKLSPQVLDAIRDYLSARGQVQDTEPLFVSCSRRNRGGRLTTRTVSAVCKATMIRAGYNSRRLTAHSLRHSAATLAIQAGMTLQDVQSFMRHSSINVTTIYLHDVNRLKSQCESAVSAAIFAA